MKSQPSQALARGDVPPAAVADQEGRPRRNTSTTLRNLLVDLGIFAVFLLVSAPRLTGLALHEWIGIALGAVIIAHLLLHWQWLVAITKRLFGRVPAATRVNYVLNTALFVDVTLVIFTGLFISGTALPFFGITPVAGTAWRALHTVSADLSLLLVGLHVALHWKWIVNATRTDLRRPVAGLFRTPRRAAPALAGTPTTAETQGVQP